MIESAAGERRVFLPRRISPDFFARVGSARSFSRLSGTTMGTEWELSVVLPDGLSLSAVELAIAADFECVLAQMSPWRADSEISRFNALPAGESLQVSPEFAHVLVAALEVAAVSHGHFDPTLASLRDYFGFGPLEVAAEPDPCITQSPSRWRSLRFDSATRELIQDGTTGVDLCAIAKGFAVDRVAQTLERMGCRSFIFEIGGEFIARACKPDGQPWWCQLEATGQTSGGPDAVIALCDQALAASGNWRRSHIVDDARVGHIFNPHSDSVPIEAETVYVLHPECMRADAWATALCAAGWQAGQALAAEAGIAALFVGSGTRELAISPAWQALLE